MPSAGEVEQFAYCAHNWFLARRGVDPHAEGSLRGIQKHLEAGQAQADLEAIRIEQRRGHAWSTRVLAAGVFLGAVAFVLLRIQSIQGNLILVTTALVLVSSAAGLLVLALVAEDRYQEGMRRSGLVPGALTQSDLLDAAPLMHCGELGLTGRPDYILQTQSGLVPVELKTGRTPDKPYPSHTLQLACYLRLVEATTGTPPAYGLLNYPQGVFRVDWDDRLKGELRATLDRMRRAAEEGRADRDHEQPGRCRGCARRAACDQRLA